MPLGPTNPTVGINVPVANSTSTPTQTLTVTSAPTIASGSETEVWYGASVNAANNTTGVLSNNLQGGFQLTAVVSGATRVDAA